MADFSITGEVRLNSDPAEKSTSKWTVAAGQMIADFAKQASSKLAEVVKSGVDYNATMESYLTNFKVMLGNAFQPVRPDRGHPDVAAVRHCGRRHHRRAAAAG